MQSAVCRLRATGFGLPLMPGIWLQTRQWIDTHQSPGAWLLRGVTIDPTLIRFRRQAQCWIEWRFPESLQWRRLRIHPRRSAVSFRDDVSQRAFFLTTGPARAVHACRSRGTDATRFYTEESGCAK